MSLMSLLHILPVLLLACCSVCLAQTTTASANAATYTNPILDRVGADPWVIRHDDYYYMTYTTNDNITILRSSVLTDWNNASTKLAFSPPPNTSYSYDLWAPELQQFPDTGLWYIIFTADVDADTPSPEQDMLCDFSCPAVNHRMFVLESSSADPWESTYTFKAELDTFGQFAIDGTYFIDNRTGRLYHIYSCWEDAYTSWPSMLCISPMVDSWTVATAARLPGRSEGVSPERSEVASAYSVQGDTFACPSSLSSGLWASSSLLYSPPSASASLPCSSSFSAASSSSTSSFASDSGSDSASASSSASGPAPPLPRQRTIISRPDQPWEKTPYNRTINVRLSSNEGPQQLTNPTTDQQFVIYSAARSDNRNYCLGRLELIGGRDPMDAASWTKYTPGCVFQQNPEQQVYGVGHASFTTSPDGREDWIVYHGMRDYENGWSARTIRTQRFTWSERDGTPVFPRPGIGPFDLPSGQNDQIANDQNGDSGESTAVIGSSRASASGDGGSSSGSIGASVYGGATSISERSSTSQVGGSGSTTGSGSTFLQEGGSMSSSINTVPVQTEHQASTFSPALTSASKPGPSRSAQWDGSRHGWRSETTRTWT